MISLFGNGVPGGVRFIAAPRGGVDPLSWRPASFDSRFEEAPTGRTAGSLGWAGLANSFFRIDPAKGIGGACLTQVLPFIDEKASPLYLAFEEAVHEGLA